ncbi:MAG: TetR/AcrR family transcriptional regulator [Mycolicibacterium rufum]|nr:TetR/AcrR family transcriptional regulator [Mycolicibacterium rufum]
MTLPARSIAKQDAILSAGRELFLAHGFRGTSVDQIAGEASVSKQTVYKHFGDKRELLMAIVASVVDTTALPFAERVAVLRQTDDVETDLIELGAEYLRSVLSEPVVQLRRLVIAEAAHLPELAALYYDHAPARTLHALADLFGHLDGRGVLTVAEPGLAAEHFAFLVVGLSIDKALFFGGSQTLSEMDLDRHVRAGVGVFLAAYGSGTR